MCKEHTLSRSTNLLRRNHSTLCCWLKGDGRWLIFQPRIFWDSYFWNHTSETVHGKTTDEWHTNDIRVHTSDIRMTYEYIRVTNEWHTSTYEWHTDDIRVHTSDIRMTYEYIRVTYKWHANDEILNCITDLELSDRYF